jgi:para-aminobenzoate synthetase component I
MTRTTRTAAQASGTRRTAAESNAQTSVHVLVPLELRLPFWKYHGLFQFEPYSFLLDSAKDPEKLGRYSFLGGDPFLVYKAKRKHGQPPAAGAAIETIRRHDAEGRPLAEPITSEKTADVFEDLKSLLDRYRVDYAGYEDHPTPLLSGAIGYFGYEAGYFIEEMPDLGADDVAMPDVYLMFCDVLLTHCHRTDRSFLSVVGRGANERAASRNAQRLRDEMLRRIEAFEANPPNVEWTGPDPQRADATTVDVKAHFDEAAYCRLVDEAKEHIFAGDIFEVCLTHRLEAPLAGDAWDLYQELRRINPAPFASYLSFPEGQIVSSSPERYVSFGPDRLAESRPIKGTRPRGATPEEDQRIQHELFGSMKDRAENVMIVDLVRNDFGRVCKFNTVHVPELMIVEPYATVFQMVSTIRGELEDGLDGLDLVRASFPGGSMTGAPKIEAMKIIDRLEPVKRGIYSGAIGYLDFSGPIDLSIVIRTFVVRDGRCYFNVGGAIVADSDPHAEYRETMDKARALKTALKNLKACQ